jgi:ABC-type glycerol-3-phosphate transport system substrate-binding protein
MGKNKLSIFQVVVLAVFGVAAVAGLLFFAGVGGLGIKDQSVGPVLVWGTLDASAFQAVLSQLGETDERVRKVVYERKDSRTYNNDLAEAIASGRGPDLFILREDFIIRHKNKISPIPYESLPRQQFESTFVQGTNLFMDSSGVIGVPIAIDPLVLYWNQDMLSSGGFVGAPKYWDEIFDIAEKVTRRDDGNNILKSAIAFGEFENVTHAKDILAALIMQAGGTIASLDDQGRLRPTLGSKTGDTNQPTQSALRFFAEFANPSKTVYSWNRSLTNSREAFASGDLALYVGYASELALLKNLNPNLNFSVAALPQIRGGERSLTFGHSYAFSIPLASANPNGALSTAFILAGSGPSALLSQARGTPSPRRDVLAVAVDGPDAVFRDMAIVARGWLDPNTTATAQIFKGMIEGVTTGSRRLSEAVGQADKELGNLLGL